MDLRNKHFRQLLQNRLNRKLIFLILLVTTIYLLCHQLNTGSFQSKEPLDWIMIFAYIIGASFFFWEYRQIEPNFKAADLALAHEPIIANVSVKHIASGDADYYQVIIWEDQKEMRKCVWEAIIDDANFSSLLTDLSLFEISAKKASCKAKVWLHKYRPILVELNGRIWELSSVTEKWIVTANPAGT